jgi:hypothetical protein
MDLRDATLMSLAEMNGAPTQDEERALMARFRMETG